MADHTYFYSLRSNGISNSHASSIKKSALKADIIIDTSEPFHPIFSFLLLVLTVISLSLSSSSRLATQKESLAEKDCRYSLALSVLNVKL